MRWSAHFTTDTDVTRRNFLCLALTDGLGVDPPLIDALFTVGTPHLPARQRNGRGVVALTRTVRRMRWWRTVTLMDPSRVVHLAASNVRTTPVGHISLV